MALHYDYSAITPYEGMTVKGIENPMGGYTPTPDGPDTFIGPLLNKMIWATLSVGIGKITEKNVGEFYARLRVSDMIDGIKPVTYGDVLKHVGLRTNVSEETRTQFYKRIGRRMDDFIRNEK